MVAGTSRYPVKHRSQCTHSRLNLVVQAVPFRAPNRIIVGKPCGRRACARACATIGLADRGIVLGEEDRQLTPDLRPMRPTPERQRARRSWWRATTAAVSSNMAPI
jgi:hypothetical protein